MPTERDWVIVATAAGALSFTAQWWGLHPVVLTVLTLTTWFAVAVRRWGLALGAAAVVVGWMSLILAVLTLTPALPFDPAIVVGIALTASIAATIPTVATVRPATIRRHTARTILASLSGTMLWIGGLAWGLLAPGGGGLSWAMYNDSTGAVWLVRHIVQYGGVSSVAGRGTSTPLPYALSASLLPPGSVIADASQASVASQLSAYALQWSVLIALTSLLAGLVVVAIGSRGGRHGWLVLGGAAGVSVLVLIAPVTGRLLDLGQSNAHVVMLLVAASVLAGLGARQHLALSLSILLAAAGLLVATWMPFAAVPGALALLVAVEARRARLDRQHVLAWMLPGFTVAAWTLIVYGRRLVAGFVTTDPENNYATIETFSRAGFWERISNPYWWPLSIGMLLAAILLLALLARRAHGPALVMAFAATGLVLGMLPFFTLMRRVPSDLDYFPAKYLSLATFCLFPLVLGAALRMLGEPRHPFSHASVAVCIVSVCGLALAAPTPPDTSRWGLAPLTIARGEHYGTHEQVAGRIVSFASNVELVVPWSYDPPFDTPVAMMDSSIGPDVPDWALAPVRSVLRYYRNDFGTSVACELADASLVPVILVTRDSHLQNEIAQECPGARITVRLEPPPAR